MLRTKKPCAECPFRKEAPAGWLGPWEGPEEIIQQAFSEAGLMCHSTVVNTGVIAPGTQVCTGSLQCANASAKSYRNDELRELADDAGKNEDVMNAFDFRKHHGGES